MADPTEQDMERAREILGKTLCCYDGDPTPELDIAQGLTAVRAEQREADARVVDRFIAIHGANSEAAKSVAQAIREQG